MPVLSSSYHNTAPPQSGGGGSTFSAAAMVAAATATATATASVVAMQDRQDIPTQFNQVNKNPLNAFLSTIVGFFYRYLPTSRACDGSAAC